jgi:hypothetical protein
MIEWQPIETAPKDGTLILLYRDGHHVLGCWREDGYWSDDIELFFGTEYARENVPSHWMPLPEPPK